MHQWTWFRALVTIVTFLLVGSVAFAQGKGKGTSDSPPGWSKGEKKGWKADVPPGLQKKGDKPPGWDKGKKKGWEAGVPPGLQKKGDKPPGWDKAKD